MSNKSIKILEEIKLHVTGIVPQVPMVLTSLLQVHNKMMVLKSSVL
jgi:hypothetical protein